MSNGLYLVKVSLLLAVVATMALAHQANDDGNQASLLIMNADGSSPAPVSLGSSDGVVREKRQIYGRYYVSTRRPAYYSNGRTSVNNNNHYVARPATYHSRVPTAVYSPNNAVHHHVAHHHVAHHHHSGHRGGHNHVHHGGHHHVHHAHHHGRR